MTEALAQDSDRRPDPPGSFVPVAPLGAGPDGTAVLARTPSGEVLELRTLTCARHDPPRWAELSARLRVHAMLEHPSIRLVQDVIEADPPVLVLSWPGRLTLTRRIAQGPLIARHAITVAEQLAHAAGAAHRIGLVHGALSPSLVRLDADGRPQIELTGTRTWETASLSMLDRACLAPTEELAHPDARTDVYGIATMLLAMLLGRVPQAADRADVRRVVPGTLGTLLHTMLDSDRDLRPSAAEVVLALREIATPRIQPASERETMDSGAPATAPAPTTRQTAPGQQLGRFRILRRIGEGGMGQVFEGLDLADGTSVALKVLRTELASDPRLLARFRKEARLLERVKNPYVANVVDINVDGGTHYIALELVEGPTVADYQDELPEKRLGEAQALTIVADACRALAAPHRAGIVHRDIKPENLMFVRPDGGRSDAGPMVKLCDFGIARTMEGAERKDTIQVTQEGVVIGTPEFMAPEQCQARPVSPATDVYALGATLYLLLSGRPPFEADDPVQLLMMHVRETVRPLPSDLSEACAEIVSRALAKDPKDRYPDAGELLDAIEKVLRGEPAAIEAHPQLPEAPAKKLDVVRVEMDLAASPEALWPYVCNSERLNRAVGMPPPRFEMQGLSEAPEDVLVTAQNRVGGTTLAWREAPFEWVEGRRWGTYREFDSGPFYWLLVDVDLTPRPEGGTHLVWRMRYRKRNWLMGLAIALEMRFKQLPTLRKVFSRIDALLAGKLAKAPENDVFEASAAKLPRAADERVQAIAAELVQEGLDAGVVEHVASYVRYGSEHEMARIRPLELAERFSLPPDETIAVLVHGAKRGLFELGWDVLCPLCRVPSQFEDSLATIQSHAHCPTCNLDYDLDFARSIELVLRASPSIRPSERKRYCVGGPFLFPHVAAQVRLEPGERFVLTLGLEAGQHRIRSPQLPNMMELKVSPSGRSHRLDLELGAHCPGAGERADSLARRAAPRAHEHAGPPDDGAGGADGRPRRCPHRRPRVVDGALPRALPGAGAGAGAARVGRERGAAPDGARGRRATLRRARRRAGVRAGDAARARDGRARPQARGRAGEGDRHRRRGVVRVGRGGGARRIGAARAGRRSARRGSPRAGHGHDAQRQARLLRPHGVDPGRAAPREPDRLHDARRAHAGRAPRARAPARSGPSTRRGEGARDRAGLLRVGGPLRRPRGSPERAGHAASDGARLTRRQDAARLTLATTSKWKGHGDDRAWHAVEAETLGSRTPTVDGLSRLAPENAARRVSFGRPVR